jgi:hypothetical protein
MNRVGTWRQLEKAFDKVVDQGIKVHRKVSDVYRPQDHGRTAWDDNFATDLRDSPSQFRPYRRHVEWTLTYPDGTVETGELDFVNTKTNEVRQKEGYKPPAIEGTDNLVPIGGGDASDDD